MAALGALGIGLATIAIVLIVAFIIISQGKDQILEAEGFLVNNASNCIQSVGCNATSSINTALDDIPGWLPLIIIASIGVILIGIIRMFAKGRGGY